MARVINFVFLPGVSRQEQDATLARIRSWSGIARAGRLSPDSTRDDVRRMAFVYIDEPVDPQAVAARMRSLPEIAEASLPAERGLA